MWLNQSFITKVLQKQIRKKERKKEEKSNYSKKQKIPKTSYKMGNIINVLKTCKDSGKSSYCSWKILKTLKIQQCLFYSRSNYKKEELGFNIFLQFIKEFMLWRSFFVGFMDIFCLQQYIYHTEKYNSHNSFIGYF